MTETGEGHDTDNQGSVCKVGTQDPENLDEELKPLVTVWSLRALRYASRPVRLSHLMSVVSSLVRFVHLTCLRRLMSE